MRIRISSKSKSIFICQMAEGWLKAVKCLRQNGKISFSGAWSEKIPADLDNRQAAEKIRAVMKKLDFKRGEVVVSLPRSSATSRYLKIPSDNPREIEKIVALQASRYLPYPAAELVTAYELLRTDEQGFAYLNLIIAHKGIIARYLDIFSRLNISQLEIVLSPYGLAGLYYRIYPPVSEPVIFIDFDAQSAEIAVLVSGKVYFSRSFKLDCQQVDRQRTLIDEINKTLDGYNRELTLPAPKKVILSGIGASQIKQALSNSAAFNVECVEWEEKIGLTGNLKQAVLNSGCSFSGLFGLGLGQREEALNILPFEEKEKIRRAVGSRDRIRLGIFIAVIFLAWMAGFYLNLGNKEKYLLRLRAELEKVSQEARPLEAIERRLNLMRSRAKEGPKTLQLLYDLHQAMPQDVLLASFNYTQDSELALRGNAPEVSLISALVANLEQSAAFRPYNIKVRYATKRLTQAGETVDFEIYCKNK